jgi:hypothetical protein
MESLKTWFERVNWTNRLRRVSTSFRTRNKVVVSIRGGEFLDKLRNYQLLNTISALAIKGNAFLHLKILLTVIDEVARVFKICK